MNLLLAAQASQARLRQLGQQRAQRNADYANARTHYSFSLYFRRQYGKFRDLGGWLGCPIHQRFAGGRILLALLLVFLALRLGNFLVNTLLPGVDASQWWRWAGAGLAGVILIPLALWRQSQSAHDQVPGRLINSLIVTLILFQLLLPAVGAIVTAIALALLSSLSQLAPFNAFMQGLNQARTSYREFLSLIVALTGLALLSLHRDANALPLRLLA